MLISIGISFFANILGPSGIALAVATRAGGLLLIAYVGLFAGLHFLTKYKIGGLIKEGKALTKYILYGLGISLAGFILAILFWPFALVDPSGQSGRRKTGRCGTTCHRQRCHSSDDHPHARNGAPRG